MRDTLRARHNEELRIGIGRNVMDTKIMHLEIEAGREWVSKIMKLQNHNVLKKHHHAEQIKEGRCPDVGYDSMVTTGRRYHKEYVSEDSHPIPSVSQCHTFEEPTLKEIAGDRLAKTRKNVAKIMAKSSTVDFGNTFEVGLEAKMPRRSSLIADNEKEAACHTESQN